MRREFMAATLAAGMVLGGAESATALTTEHATTYEQQHKLEIISAAPWFVQGVGKIALAPAFANRVTDIDDMPNKTTSSFTQPVKNTAPPTSSASLKSKHGRKFDIPNATEDAMLERLSGCESSHKWDINTGNHYYGGVQFDLPTWNAYGGKTFAPRPDLASKQEQKIVAITMQHERGTWKPWPACAKRFGWN